MIAITHTPADGTILDGTSKGDGTNHLLKPLTWRWSRQLAVWYLPASRDTAPRTAVITGTAEKLRAAGHEVIVAIDGRHRDPEVVEADRAAPGSSRPGPTPSPIGVRRRRNTSPVTESRPQPTIDRACTSRPTLVRSLN